MVAIPEIPLPSAGSLALALLFYAAGWATPTYYGAERIRGFGRAIAAKLPYKPPAGMNEEEAMRAATMTAEQAEEEAKEDDTT